MSFVRAFLGMVGAAAAVAAPGVVAARERPPELPPEITPAAREAFAKLREGDGLVDPRERVRAYEEALRLDPDSVEGYVRLAEAQIERGSLRNARRACEDALGRREDDYGARNNLGYLLLLDGLRQGATARRYRKTMAAAEAELARAVRERPQREEACWNLGTVRFQDGRVDLALETWNLAVRLRRSRTGIAPAAPDPETVEAFRRGLAPRCAGGEGESPVSGAWVVAEFTASRRALDAWRRRHPQLVAYPPSARPDPADPRRLEPWLHERLPGRTHGALSDLLDGLRPPTPGGPDGESVRAKHGTSLGYVRDLAWLVSVRDPADRHEAAMRRSFGDLVRHAARGAVAEAAAELDLAKETVHGGPVGRPETPAGGEGE